MEMWEVLHVLARLEAYTHGHEGWQDDHPRPPEEARKVLAAFNHPTYTLQQIEWQDNPWSGNFST